MRARADDLAFHALFPSVGRCVCATRKPKPGEGFAVALGAPRRYPEAGAWVWAARTPNPNPNTARPRARDATRAAREDLDQLASTWLDLLIRGGTAESTPPGLGDCVRAPAGSDDSPLGLSGEGDAVREGVSDGGA